MMKRKNPMKYVVLIGAVSAGLLSACSRGQTAEAAKSDWSSAEEPQSAESFTVSASENPVSAGETESAEMESTEMESSEMENTGMENTLDDSRIITGQSFDVTWKNWGEVRFISYAPPADHAHDDVTFYLSKNNEIVYEFPRRGLKALYPGPLNRWIWYHFGILTVTDMRM